MSLRGSLRGAILTRGVAGGGGIDVAAPGGSPPVIEDFTYGPEPVISGVEGTFSFSTSGSVDGKLLDPGDASGVYTLTVETSQTHTYATPGTYTASLVISGIGGSDTETIPNIQASDPNLVAPIINSFTISDNPAVEDVQVTFSWTLSGGTPALQTLDPGDGSGAYTVTPGTTSQVHTYDFADSYSPSLVVSNGAGSDSDSIAEVTVNTTPAPNISVTGNAVSIADGDATPSTSDHTSFVSVTEGEASSSRTFTVTNTGNQNLVTSGMTVPTGFTITDALSGTITPGNSDTFTVRLDVATVGVKSGDISFTTNVAGKNPFNFAISGEVVSAGAVVFQQVAIAKSGTSGEHWLSPIGIPGRRNVETSRARRTKLVARYPNNGSGTLYSIQSEQFNHHYDTDALQHCTGHVKLPAGYVAGEDIGIGYSETHSFPSAPNWTTLTAGGDSGFRVDISVYEPIVHWVCFDRNPVNGDTIEVRIIDDGGTHTYTHTLTGAARDTGNSVRQFEQICKKINAGGLYKTADLFTRPQTPVGTTSLGKNDEDMFHGQWNLSTVNCKMGLQPGTYTDSPTQFAPRITLTNPSNHEQDRWAAKGFYIWPAWRAGEPYAYEVQVQITRAGGSSLSAWANMTAPNTGTLTTNGTITPLNSVVNRIAYRASFDDATATADSPWFDGHQVRQIERRMAFKKVSDATAHPHLEAVFRVSWDRDGNIIDRQVTVENPKMHAFVRDHWYDAEVFVGGVSQTSGVAEKYRHMYHHMWAYWRWAQSKPAGFCRAADFMAARLILPWVVDTTKNATTFMSTKLRGHPIDHETTNKYLGVDYTLGYYKADLNDPLYPGAWDFGSLGGARHEIGMFNSYEWEWWTSDMIASWPSMEAMVDNVAGAHGFCMRMESQTGEDVGAPPNMYLRHHSGWNGTEVSKAYDAGHPYVSFGRPHYPDRIDGVTKTVTQKYALTGEFTPAISHSPSLGLYSAWIARPEKYLHDAQEMWAFRHKTAQSAISVSVVKTGGVAGDANHHLSFSLSNGNRTVAWPCRELARAAFMRFEGARRRTYWRRVGNEIGWVWNRITEKSTFGEFDIQNHRAYAGDINSNTNFATYFDDLSVPDAIGVQCGPHTETGGADVFKSNYMTMTFCHALDLGVVTKDTETQANIDRCTWVSDVLEYVPNQTTDWTWFLGGGALTGALSLWRFKYVQARGITGAPNDGWWYNPTANYTTWSAAERTNLSGLMALLASRNDAGKLLMNHYPTPADCPMKRLDAGYSIPRQHHSAMLLVERHNSNSTKRDQAYYWRNKILTQWPSTSDWTIANGHRSTQVGLKSADYFKQMDSIHEADIPT